MDDVLKKKIENRQHTIITDEDIRRFGYMKTGKAKSGKIRWIEKQHAKETSHIQYLRKKNGESKNCIIDGVLTSWNKGLTMETDDRIISSWNKGLRHEIDPRIPEAWNKGKTNIFSEETRNKMSEKKMGSVPWNKGLTKKTDERVKIGGEKISVSNKGRISWNTGLTNDDDERMRKLSEHSTLYLDEKVLYQKYIVEEKTLDDIAIEMGTCKPIVSRELKRFNIPMWSRSDISKRIWKNHNDRNTWIMKIVRGVSTSKPTSYEEKIIDLCKEFGFPFEFVGNGNQIINGKIPDFVATNGQKLIIETYSKYWHDDDYEDTRFDFLNNCGYDVLFLNDNDLNVKDWKKICKMKIEKFMEKRKNE